MALLAKSFLKLDWPGSGKRGRVEYSTHDLGGSTSIMESGRVIEFPILIPFQGEEGTYLCTCTCTCVISEEGI